MKKALSIALAGLGTLVILSGTASAWTYGLSGSGMCQPDGTFKIIWKIDNTTENQALRVTYSSNTAVVPVGTQVPKRQTANFPQIVYPQSMQPGNYSLTLKANWPGDQTERTRTATVNLNENCVQPVTPQPPTGQGAVTTPAAVLGAQVEAPRGAVDAGNSSTSAGSIVSMVGLFSALAGTSYAIFRMRKN
jgi:hypothetical protein